MLAAVLSVVAAVFYTGGLSLQQQAAAAEPGGRGGLRTARQIIARPRWIAGIALTGVGFGLHGVALSVGALTVVQILQTSQIVFAVPLSARNAGVPVSRGDWIGAVMVAAGLVLLLVAVRPSEDAGAGTVDRWALTAAVGAALVTLVVVLARAVPRARATLLGLAAGAVAGIEAATLKIVSDDLAEGVTVARLVGPAVWATVAFGVTGVVLQNMALRAGRLSVALSTMTIASPVTSTVIGIGVFGERLELSVGTVMIAAAAIALAAAGVVALARSQARTAEASPRSAPAVAG